MMGRRGRRGNQVNPQKGLKPQTKRCCLLRLMSARQEPIQDMPSISSGMRLSAVLNSFNYTSTVISFGLQAPWPYFLDL